MNGARVGFVLLSVGLLSAGLFCSSPSRALAEASIMSDPSLPTIGSLWNWSDIPATEEVFRREAARADSAGDSARALAMETQVARTLGLQRRFDDAHALLDQVESRLGPNLTSSTTPASEVEVRLRLERGRVWNSSGNLEAAKGPFADAFEVAVAEKLEPLAIDAAHMMAIVETGDASRIWYERGVEMAESSVDPEARRWLGPLYNNYGWTLHDAGRYEEALVVFENGLTWRIENSGPAQIRIARYTVARTLRSLERCPEALEILRELERELAEAGAQDGYVQEELGECLLATGKQSESRPYFGRAFELLSSDPWLKEQEPARLSRLEALSQP